MRQVAAFDKRADLGLRLLDGGFPWIGGYLRGRGFQWGGYRPMRFAQSIELGDGPALHVIGCEGRLEIDKNITERAMGLRGPGP